MNFVIEPATLTQSKAKIALVGPAGSGKTLTALITAAELGDKVLVIDTENGSSAKYADRFNFSILRLPDYRLETYIAALDYAAKQGFDVVILDSLSHAWAGAGGALETADAAGRKYGGNKFAGWADVTPLQNKLIDTILKYPVHLIATMRMKIEYALIDAGGGKTKPQKLGMGIVQRDSVEYEFDILGEMDVEHNLRVTKTRCMALDNLAVNKPDGAFGRIIAEWLGSGQAAPVPVTPAIPAIGHISASGQATPAPSPSDWLPNLAEFKAQVVGDFGLDWPALSKILKEDYGFVGYKPAKATDMYNALAAHFKSRQHPVIAVIEAELQQLEDAFAPDQAPLRPIDDDAFNRAEAETEAKAYQETLLAADPPPSDNYYKNE